MGSEKKACAIGGDMVQTLQVNVMFLVVKALISTHPDPNTLRAALQDLFVQFQSSETFLRLPQDARDVAREMLSSILLAQPDKSLGPSVDPQ